MVEHIQLLGTLPRKKAPEKSKEELAKNIFLYFYCAFQLPSWKIILGCHPGTNKKSFYSIGNSPVLQNVSDKQ